MNLLNLVILKEYYNQVPEVHDLHITYMYLNTADIKGYFQFITTWQSGTAAGMAASVLDWLSSDLVQTFMSPHRMNSDNFSEPLTFI